MTIKTETGHVNVAGRGTTALGIVGTVLGGAALMNNNGGCGCNNGILGGLFGNNNNCYETKESAALREQVAFFAADSATNQKVLDLYQFTVGEFKERDAATVDLAVADARSEEREACLRKEVERLQAITAAQSQELCDNRVKIAQIEGSIVLESERRACGDQNLYNYVNATFVPGQLTLNADKICPPVKLA